MQVGLDWFVPFGHVCVCVCVLFFFFWGGFFLVFLRMCSWYFLPTLAHPVLVAATEPPTLPPTTFHDLWLMSAHVGEGTGGRCRPRQGRALTKSRLHLRHPKSRQDGSHLAALKDDVEEQEAADTPAVD